MQPPSLPDPHAGGQLILLLSLDDRRPEHLARRVTAFVLARLGAGGRLDDVLVAVSELVTNARRHAPPPWQLRIFSSGPAVTVAVADGAADYAAIAWRLKAPAAGAATLAESGRGLRLVAGLFPRACGAEPARPALGARPGKQVWITTPAHHRGACLPVRCGCCGC